MEYLIRLAQMHETFRRPELEALAVLHNVDLEILEYSDQVREKSKHFHFLFCRCFPHERAYSCYQRTGIMEMLQDVSDFV